MFISQEKETVVLQRRAIRTNTNLEAGTILTRDHLTVLRPCPIDALPPYEMDKVIGKRIERNIDAGEHLRWIDIA